jgi:uncharacterized repeat protein (TIGR01451 family)
MTMDVRRASRRCLAIVLCLGPVAAPLVAWAQADVALEKSVDVTVPGPGQPVQFTVRAVNVGSREAPGVLVHDPLPPGLVAPAGTGVYVSAGDYDAATGHWSIAQLAVGGEATLVMPAVVAMASPPACLVNVAENLTPDDASADNDRAAAAVKLDAAARCADLVASFQAIAMVPPVCSTSRYFDFFVEVANRGPDEARDVIVDLTQIPAVVPGLRLVGGQCSGTRCRFDSIAPGSKKLLRVQSDSFANPQSRSLRFAIAASTTDVDYAAGDNQAYVDYVLTPFVSCDDIGVGDAYAMSGCFIATAAYGSADESHVAALREFRDRILRRSAAGRTFIDWYYAHSPPVARYISARPWARAVVRAMLAPAVVAIIAPWRTLCALLSLVLATWAWRRRGRAVA